MWTTVSSFPSLVICLVATVHDGELSDDHADLLVEQLGFEEEEDGAMALKVAESEIEAKLDELAAGLDSHTPEDVQGDE